MNTSVRNTVRASPRQESTCWKKAAKWKLYQITYVYCILAILKMHRDKAPANPSETNQHEENCYKVDGYKSIHYRKHYSTIIQSVRKFEPPNQIYMTRTGRAYHLLPTCSRSEPGTAVSLKPCIRCFKAALKELLCCVCSLQNSRSRVSFDQEQMSKPARYKLPWEKMGDDDNGSWSLGCQGTTSCHKNICWVVKDF